MLSISFALSLLVVLFAFVAAWHIMPSGWLTATTGTIAAVMVALHEAMGDMMPELRALMPPEFRPWLVVAFLLLTVAARFRKRSPGQ